MQTSPFISPQALPPIPDDIPIFASHAYDTWIALASSANPALRFDGSQHDFEDYLKTLSWVLEQSLQSGMTVFVTKDIGLSVPPTHAQEVVFAYTYRTTGRRCYHLSKELADALLETDLGWIEAQAFRDLPDGFALLIPPMPGLSVYGDNGWHPITDIFVERIRDEGRLALQRENFPGLPADAQFFCWEAISRNKLRSEGALFRNWGAFPVSEDMRLDTLMAGLERWSIESVEHTRSIPLEVASASPKAPFHSSLADYMTRTTSGFLNEAREHLGEQTEGCLQSISFIAKWVLFSATNGFKQAVSRRMPPGFKAKPKTSKKAKAIQDRVLANWGHQFRVSLPPQEPSEEQAAGAHASPVRHRVRGFFRNQPYGSGRALRKLIWIQPFWRGKELLSRS